MGDVRISPTTVVSESYALFGQKQVGPPDRPDPTPAEREAARRADEITEADLLAERRWTTGDLALALGCGLPAPRMRTTVSRLSWRTTRIAIYSRRALVEWDARLRALLG